VRRSCRDEDSVAEALDDGVPFDAVLVIKAISQLLVEVPALVVDGVVVRLELDAALDGHPVQQVADLVGVARVVDVPQRAGHLVPVADPLQSQDVAPRLLYGSLGV